MTDSEIQRILDRCRFRGWRFRTAHMVDDRPGVALEVEDVADNFDDRRVRSFTRCAAITGDNEQAVIAAAFAAVMRHQEHEAGELFHFADLRPFNPHRDE